MSRETQLQESARPVADPESWVWPWDGALESVQDARDGRTRGQAIARYCHDANEWFPDARGWKRHARALTRQEQWEWYRTAYLDENAPQEAPADWAPDIWNEEMPSWEFCGATDDGAAAVWVLAHRGSHVPGQPRNPTPALEPYEFPF